MMNIHPGNSAALEEKGDELKTTRSSAISANVPIRLCRSIRKGMSMNQRSIQQIIGISLITFLLTGCSTPADTAGSSTSTVGPLNIAKLKTIQSPGKETAAIALSPDGKILACGSYGDDSLYLIDVSTGSVAMTLKGHTAPVSSLAFSPAGALLASTGTVNLPPKRDGSVRIWDVKTGKELAVFKTTGTSQLTFSPDSATLAGAGGGDPLQVILWDAGSGSEKRIIKGVFSYAAFSPDGNLLASGSRDDQVHVIKTATGEEAMKLAGHGGWIKAAAFSPKGGLLASGSEDMNIHLWDTANGNKLQSLTGHKSEIGFLAFSADGNVLASLGSGTNVTREGGRISISVGPKDKSLRFWDVKTGKEIALIEVPDGISEVSFNSDWTLMATSSGKDFIQLWSVKR